MPVLHVHWGSTDEMSPTQSSRSRHQEVRAFVESLLWELASASEHIFLMGRCYMPIKSAIRGSMNHLMEQRAACTGNVCGHRRFFQEDNVRVTNEEQPTFGLLPPGVMKRVFRELIGGFQ